MSQQPAQFCPQCGAPTEASQRFCTNCGATTGADADNPTIAASQTPSTAGPVVTSDTAGPTQAALSTPGVPYAEQAPSPTPPPASSNPYLANASASIPPPPPPSASIYNPYAARAPQAPQDYAQNASASPEYPPVLPKDGTYPPLPAYAQKPRRNRGCLITSIVLLVVLAAGVGGFVLARQRLPSGVSNGQQGGGYGANGGVTSTPGAGNTPASNVGSSEQLNLKITYAGVNITVLSAQVASSFSDDNSSPGPAGVVRLNLLENNPTSRNPEYLESDVLLLVLPGGSTLQTNMQKQSMGISPDAGVSRQNWIDFPLSTQIALNQLTLRIGTASENQMNIPLRTGADLSKYQDKTANPNAQFQYAGLNWTLKTATKSYSYNSTQVTEGNLYVIITLAAVNNSQNDLIADPGSYMRLQAGSSTQAPEAANTFPITVASHASGSGAVAFLMPQDATSFTLIMLGQSSTSPPTSQVTQTFQFQ